LPILACNRASLGVLIAQAIGRGEIASLRGSSNEYACHTRKRPQDLEAATCKSPPQLRGAKVCRSDDGPADRRRPDRVPKRPQTGSGRRMALLAIGSNNMINATLYPNLNCDFIRDIALVASVYRVPQVMEVNPSFPAKTVPEFIAYAKAHPAEISFAS